MAVNNSNKGLGEEAPQKTEDRQCPGPGHWNQSPGASLLSAWHHVKITRMVTLRACNHVHLCSLKNSTGCMPEPQKEFVE